MAHDWTFDGKESLLDELIEQKIISLLEKEEIEANYGTSDFYKNFFENEDDDDDDYDDNHFYDMIIVE